MAQVNTGGNVGFPPIANIRFRSHNGAMEISSEFWLTTGKARYEAVIGRYDQGQISAQTACEYLAELLFSDEPFDEAQRHVIQTSHLLAHEASEGTCVNSAEFADVLAHR